MKNQIKKILKQKDGFTMIEILMVILVVAILSAVAIPQFLDFRDEGVKAAVSRNLQSVRSGITNQKAQALLRCDGISPDYKLELVTLSGNDITAGQCDAADVPASQRPIVDAPTFPKNPVSGGNNTVIACDTAACADPCDASGCDGTSSKDGWCYNAANGQFWADSQKEVNGEKFCAL